MRSSFFLSSLILSTLSSASPFPSPNGAANPTPTLSNRATSPRLFTVQAFESPNPSGVGLTGYYLSGSGSGALTLTSTAPKPPTVFYVDSGAHAFIDANPPIPVYIDTSQGLLAAGSSPPSTALTVPFYHLGTGTTLYTVQNGYATEGAAVFQWVGSENGAWFACPLGTGGKGGQALGLVKQMTVVNPDVGNCSAVELGAVDYEA